MEIVLLHVALNASHETTRGGTIPPKKLERKMQRFSEGKWVELFAESEEASRVARTAAVRKRKRGSD